MKLLICLSAAIFLASPAYAVLDGEIDLPEFSGEAPAPQNMDVEFPADAVPQAPRAIGSLAGSTFNWERDQRAAWGGGIPGLTPNEGQNACGLIAAEALIRHHSNDPGLDKIVEIRDTAVRNDRWDQNNGMHGAGAEQALLGDFGIQVSAPIMVGDLGQAEQLIRESLDRGNPVIISTLRHYFFAEGYDNNGRLFVGHTGEVMKVGSAQMTLAQISQAGGGSLVLLIPQ